MSEREPLPESIRELIERQVSVLSTEDQELLEVGAVAGMTFSVAVIARVLERPRERTEDQYRALAEKTHFLQKAEVRRRPRGRGTQRYSFVHALYHHVIYDRIAVAKRRRFHQSIGERTEAVYAGTTEIVAPELAAHFEKSGDNDRALKYMLQAAQRSFSLCAYAETIEDASKALKFAGSLPATTHRKEVELNLQLLMAIATCGSKGYAVEETGHAFARARELSHTINNDGLVFQSLAGIWSYYLLRGQLAIAQNRAHELLSLAQRTRQPVFLLNAHLMVAMAHFYQGRFQSAHDHFEEAIQHYDFELHRSKLSLFSWDPGVLVSCYDAQALWFLGYPEKAEEAAESAVALAKKLASPFNEALCYAIHATYYSYRRDATKALAMADAALRVSHDRGFLHWIVLGTLNKGWSLCRLGDVTQGLPLLLDGLTRWKSMGAEMAVPTFQVLLGEVYKAKEAFRKALTSVEEGLAVAAHNNDHHYDAGLYRLKGELLLETSKRNRVDNFIEAEACFKFAVDITRKQKARSVELRAVMRLARLWQVTGKKRDAYQMLERVYRKFTEGFDTPDLKQAKALLDELA